MLNIFGLKNGCRLQRKDTFFQYSTSEQFTGEYWINGEKIYTKTFAGDRGGAVTNNYDFATGISNIKEAWIDNQNTYVYALGDERVLSGSAVVNISSGTAQGTNQGEIFYLPKLNVIRINFGSIMLLNRWRVTLRYTKTTG